MLPKPMNTPVGITQHYLKKKMKAGIIGKFGWVRPDPYNTTRPRFPFPSLAWRFLGKRKSRKIFTTELEWQLVKTPKPPADTETESPISIQFSFIFVN